MIYTRAFEKVKDVNTTIPVEEKRVLHGYASKIPDNGIIVDIGTCAGGSAFMMALASKSSVQIWTIDPNENKDFFEKRAALGLADRIHFIGDTSDNAVLDWNKDIDLLFIDGNHSPQAITNDINNWGKFVKKDSIVLLHDYFWYGDVVQQAIDRADVKLELIDVPFGFYNNKKVGIAVTKRI